MSRVFRQGDDAGGLASACSLEDMGALPDRSIQWVSERLWALALGPLTAQLKERNQLWRLSDLWVWSFGTC